MAHFRGMEFSQGILPWQRQVQRRRADFSFPTALPRMPGRVRRCTWYGPTPGQTACCSSSSAAISSSSSEELPAVAGPAAAGELAFMMRVAIIAGEFFAGQEVAPGVELHPAMGYTDKDIRVA